VEPVKLDALLFLQQSDIAAYCRHPSNDAGLKKIFIDPGLAEAAMRQGLDPAGFDYRPIAVGRHFQARAATEAMNRAMAIDHTLASERGHLFGSGVFAGWDHVPLRFFFLRALITRHLGEACEGLFPETAVGLLRPRKPQQFYFDSYVSTDAFTAGRERWRIVGHYDEVAHFVPDASSACFDLPWMAEQAGAGKVHALLHLPTVYAHLQHYMAQILQRYPLVTELPSPFWDIPLTRDRRPLLALGDLPTEWKDERCTVYRQRAAAVLDAALTDLLPQPEPRQLQVDLIADQCYLQAVNYLGLVKALKGTRPHLIVTEHDTGAVGPLFSAAERLGSSITVVPHSSYPTQPLPHAINVTAIERDGFASPVRSVWGARVRTRPIRLAPHRPMPMRGEARTVCLLLNTLASRGISYIDLAALAEFHTGLERLCRQRGATLLVRLKPGSACLPVAAGALGVTPQVLQSIMELPLGQLAEATDVCISYGELTSAVIDFFESGSYVMHVTEEVRSIDLLNSSNLSTLLTLHSLPGQEALKHLDEQLTDATHYSAELANQRNEFSARLTATDGSLFED
jgi:hypothetical protein